MKEKYLLAIPVFNEAGYVRGVLERSRRHARDILVIDDGSTDGTAAILDGYGDITVIRHERNLGYGRSLIDAFKFACDRGYGWLITMDCDEQHEPDAIPLFISAMEADDADIISGSRYLVPDAAGDSPPADRRAINRRITRLVNERLDLGITDAFCGFKAYRCDALASMRITESGYAMPLQLWAEAARLNLRVRELAIRLVYNDPTRHFGGELDDAAARYRHYLHVFRAALADVARGVRSDETVGAEGGQSACTPGAVCGCP